MTCPLQYRLIYKTQFQIQDEYGMTHLLHLNPNSAFPEVVGGEGDFPTDRDDNRYAAVSCIGHDRAEARQAIARSRTGWPLPIRAFSPIIRPKNWPGIRFHARPACADADECQPYRRGLCLSDARRCRGRGGFCPAHGKFAGAASHEQEKDHPRRRPHRPHRRPHRQPDDAGGSPGKRLSAPYPNSREMRRAVSRTAGT